MKKLTKEEFIERCKKIHNNRYDYSLVDYVNNQTKVKIVCPIHGEFEQVPASHLNLSTGCSACSGKKKLTSDYFIKKAKEIHGDKYDYSMVNYVNNKSKIEIICKIHGTFTQTPNRHVSKKQGCPSCYGNKKSNIIEFTQKANKIHFNKYDYSLVNYENCMTKVDIICNKHGIFKQKPNCHLNGEGCPNCKLSKGEKSVKKLLNDIGVKYIQQHVFDSCKNIKPLPFDFYLPEHNICIEYDGVQHFKPYGWDETGERFRQTIKNDEIKNQYCESNNIGLIRINYSDNVINKLSHLLFRH